jgi:8-oxo-dGTP pyrophosphatase MutT (NUDIX family)
MKYLWRRLGNLAYYLGLPLLRLVLNNSKRTRVLIMSGDKILVVKGWLSDGLWELPGGGLRRGELKVDGATREVREETSLQLNRDDLEFITDFDIEDKGIRLYLSLFKTETSETSSIKNQFIEIIDHLWINMDQLTDQNSSPDLLMALHKLKL